MLCFVVVIQSFIINSHKVFIHIHQGCFAGTGAIDRLPQCQWSKPDGYGKISQCITTTKHSKAKTVCIFLGIYCRYQTRLGTPSQLNCCWCLGIVLTIWVRSRKWGCLVTWFCYHMIAKLGNKTAAPLWLNPHKTMQDMLICQLCPWFPIERILTTYSCQFSTEERHEMWNHIFVLSKNIQQIKG